MHSTDRQKTRERLLAAAVRVFAQHGYGRATVQAICREARANIAAVNYHFGGKEALYEAVCRQVVADRRQPPEPQVEEATSPEDRIARFVEELVRHLLENDRSAMHERIMAHELVEPTPIFVRVIVPQIRVRFEHLSRAVEELLGEAATPHEVARCVFSILGQCFHYARKREVLRQVAPPGFFGPEAAQELARHITAFSLAAIAGLAGAAAGSGSRGRRCVNARSKS